jgi:hypothetical protein
MQYNFFLIYSATRFIVNYIVEFHDFLFFFFAIIENLYSYFNDRFLLLALESGYIIDLNHLHLNLFIVFKSNVNIVKKNVQEKNSSSCINLNRTLFTKADNVSLTPREEFCLKCLYTYIKNFQPEIFRGVTPYFILLSEWEHFLNFSSTNWKVKLEYGPIASSKAILYRQVFLKIRKKDGRYIPINSLKRKFIHNMLFYRVEGSNQLVTFYLFSTPD